MSHKDGRVVLSAWVEPVLRDYAREAAKVANLEFSRWVERAVRQTMARESADRAIVAASERVYHEGWLTEEGPVSRKVTRYDAEETKARRAFFAAAERVAMRNTEADMLALVRALSDWKRVEKASGR